MSAHWYPKVAYYKTKEDKVAETLFECYIDELIDYDIYLEERNKEERQKQKKEALRIILTAPLKILFYTFTFQITKASLLKNLFKLSLITYFKRS